MGHKIYTWMLRQALNYFICQGEFHLRKKFFQELYKHYDGEFTEDNSYTKVADITKWTLIAAKETTPAMNLEMVGNGLKDEAAQFTEKGVKYYGA